MKILSIALPIAFFLFPALALAASPVTDSFDTGISAWTGMEGRSLPATFSPVPPCYYNACAGRDTNVNFGMQSTGTSLNTGAYVAYFNHVPSSGGPPSDSLFFPSICDGNCDTATYKVEKSVSDTFDDGTYHSIYVAWRDGATDKEFCYMVDDTNDSDCTYSDLGLSIPNGTQFDTVGFWLQNTMTTGESFYVDQLSDAPFTPPPVNTNTRIDTVTPASGSTIATSTGATFATTGYISSADYIPGMEVIMTYGQTTQSTIPAAPVTKTVTFSVTAPGAFSFSTTSAVMGIGSYSLRTAIVGYSNINFFGFFDIPFTETPDFVNATTTSFVAAMLTGVDIFNASTTADINSYLASSTVSLASCTSFTSFNLGDCINILLIPQPGPISDLFSNFKSQFLSYWPWGYITRIATILGTTGTSSFPDITISIWTPYTEGNANDTTTLRFDENEMLANASNDLNSVDANGTSLNWRGVLEPYLALFLAICILFIIVHDLMGTAQHRKR